MSVEVMAWNVKDGFSDADRIPMLLDQMRWDMPDVAVFSEAYDATNTGQLDNAVEDLEKMGYLVGHVPYEDDDERNDRHGFMMVVADHLKDGVTISPLRLASRYALDATIVDPVTEKELRIIGMHGDDRSGERRSRMLGALAANLPLDDEGNVEGAVAVVGDLNSMYRNDPYARKMRLLRPARPFMRPMYADPDPLNPPTGVVGKFKRKVSLGYRVVDMASDCIMEDMEAMGLREADETHAPTIPAENPKARLDHIMVSKDMHVLAKGVGDYNASADHGIYNPVSDHLLVRALLRAL